MASSRHGTITTMGWGKDGGMTTLEEWLVKLQVISTSLQLGIIDRIRAAELLDDIIRQMNSTRQVNQWP